MTDRAQAWRAAAVPAARAEAVELMLPSGVAILARRPGPAFAAGLGRLPASLATVVSSAGTQGEGEPSRGDVVELAATLRALLVYVVVEPQVVDKDVAGPGEILPREIPNTDLEYILWWAMRRDEAASLEAFRLQRGDGGVVRGSKDVALQAERVAGDRGSDAGTKSGSRRSRRLTAVGSGGE